MAWSSPLLLEFSSKSKALYLTQFSRREMNTVGSRLAGETSGAGDNKNNLISTVPKPQGDVKGVVVIEW